MFFFTAPSSCMLMYKFEPRKPTWPSQVDVSLQPGSITTGTIFATVLR